MSIVVSFCSHGEEPGNTQSPYVILPLVPALELDDSPLYRLQSEVSPVLAAFQQVAARPSGHVFTDLQHHICRFQKRGIKDDPFRSFSLLLSLIPKMEEEDPPPFPFTL